MIVRAMIIEPMRSLDLRQRTLGRSCPGQAKSSVFTSIVTVA